MQKCQIGVILSDMSRHARPTNPVWTDLTADLHRARQKVPIFYNGTLILTRKFVPSHGGDLSPHLIHGPLGPAKSSTHTTSRSVQQQGSCVPIQNNVDWTKADIHAKCHLDPSSRLATINMGRKLGGAPPRFWGGEWVSI